MHASIGVATAALQHKAIYEGNGRIPCPDGIEVLYLYLSVLDSEHITLKTIKFCIGPYE